MSEHTRLKVAVLLARVGVLASKTLSLMERTMASQAELNAKIAELNQAVIDDEAADDKNEADLQAVIDGLKAQLAAGMTPDQIQEAIDGLEAIKGNLHAPATPPTP